MREIGITMIVLGLGAGAASWLTPESWQLGRWAMALLMLGAPLVSLVEWAERRRERMITEMPDDHEPPFGPRSPS